METIPTGTFGSFVEAELRLALAWKASCVGYTVPWSNKALLDEAARREEDEEIEDNGCSLRVRRNQGRTKTAILQVKILDHMVGSRGDEAWLSDGRSLIFARFSQLAKTRFRAKRDSAKDTLDGTLLQIKSFEIGATHCGSSAKKVSLTVKDFVWFERRQPPLGKPTRIDHRDSIRLILNHLSNLRALEEDVPPKSLVDGQKQGQIPEPVSPSSIASQVANITTTKESPLESQMHFETQLPLPRASPSQTSAKPARLGEEQNQSGPSDLSKRGDGDPGTKSPENKTAELRGFLLKMIGREEVPAQGPAPSKVTEAANPKVSPAMTHNTIPSGSPHNADQMSLGAGIPRGQPSDTVFASSPKEPDQNPESGLDQDALGQGSKNAESLKPHDVGASLATKAVEDGPTTENPLADAGNRETSTACTHPAEAKPSEAAPQKAPEAVRLPVEECGKEDNPRSTSVREDLVSTKTTYDPWSGMKLDRSLVIVPNDQQDILKREESWFPAQAGRTFPPFSVPRSVLQQIMNCTQGPDEPNHDSTEGQHNTAVASAVGDAENGSSPEAPGENHNNDEREADIHEEKDMSDDEDGTSIPWSPSPTQRRRRESDCSSAEEEMSPSPTPVPEYREQPPPDSSFPEPPPAEGLTGFAAPRLGQAAAYSDPDLEMGDAPLVASIAEVEVAEAGPEIPPAGTANEAQRPTSSSVNICRLENSHKVASSSPTPRYEPNATFGKSTGRVSPEARSPQVNAVVEEPQLFSKSPVSSNALQVKDQQPRPPHAKSDSEVSRTARVSPGLDNALEISNPKCRLSSTDKSNNNLQANNPSMVSHNTAEGQSPNALSPQAGNEDEVQSPREDIGDSEPLANNLSIPESSPPIVPQRSSPSRNGRQSSADAPTVPRKSGPSRKPSDIFSIPANKETSSLSATSPRAHSPSALHSEVPPSKTIIPSTYDATSFRKRALVEDSSLNPPLKRNKRTEEERQITQYSPPEGLTLLEMERAEHVRNAKRNVQAALEKSSSTRLSRGQESPRKDTPSPQHSSSALPRNISRASPSYKSDSGETKTRASSMADPHQRKTPLPRAVYGDPPPINSRNILQQAPNQQMFELFCESYPVYKGNTRHFQNLCKRFANFRMAGALANELSADDFVICHHTEYLPLQESGERVITYEPWYLKMDREPLWHLNVITDQYLDSLTGNRRKSGKGKERQVLDVRGESDEEGDDTARRWWQNADDAPVRMMLSELLRLKSVAQDPRAAPYVVDVQKGRVTGPNLDLGTWEL